MNDSIPDLKIEMMDDDQGDGLILLEQDSGGNIDRVAIHPIHLRYMAEKMGLLESSDPTAQKTIATLQRRMLVLYERIEHLSDWLHNLSDTRHADLSHEQAHIAGTEFMAKEFCADFAPGMLDASVARPEVAEKQRQNRAKASATNATPCSPTTPAPAAQGALL